MCFPLNFESESPYSETVILVTRGLPIVKVPVLSNTNVSTPANFSKTFPPRKSRPLVAPNEVPTWHQTKSNQNGYKLK